MTEPFAVQCLTCGSRLKVSDPALLGTIATCPKCNSMVQIVPESNPSSAAAQVAVGQSSVDSQAITEDAIDVGSEMADPATVPSGFNTPQTLQDDGIGDSVPSPAPPDWESQRTQRSRQIGLIVALSLSSLIGAVLFFGWFVRSWRKDTTTVAEVAPENNVSPEHSEDDSPSEPSLPEPESPEVEPPEVEPQDTPSDTPSDAVANDPPKTVVPSPAPIVPPADVPGDLLPVDTILDPLAPASEPTEVDEDASKLEKLPDPLRKLLPDFNLPEAQQNPTMDAPASLDQVTLDQAVQNDLDPMMIANPPATINMRGALSIQFALSSKNGKYPLADLMLIVSQVTGVPIQIDWVSFDLLGVNLRDEVPIKGGWVKAEDLLNDVAASIGAVIEKEELMVKLTPSEEKRQQRLADLLDLSDFGAGQASAQKLMNEFLGGDGIGQGQQEQELAALTVEAIRRMRGVAAKVDDASFNRWAQSTSDPVLDWPLVDQGTADPQYAAPITMAGFLRRISQRNNVSCYVNWFDATRRRLSPEQLTMPYCDQPAGAVLADALKPFKLQARRVGTDFWWIGAAATYDRFPVIVWTEPLGADRAVFMQRVSGAAIGQDIFRMAIDADTGRALLLLPRYIVKQMPKLQNGLNLTKTP